MKASETKKVPGLIKIVIVLGCMLITTACREVRLTHKNIPPAQKTLGYPSPSITPEKLPKPSPSPINSTRTPEFPTTEDKYLRVSSPRDQYSISDSIRIDLTVIGEFVYFHTPCDRWFERKESNAWVKVGYCPKSNFTDEPGSFGAGDTVKLILPISRADEYLYSYTLIPGTYRYTITYWTQTEPHLLIYSPEITIVDLEP